MLVLSENEKHPAEAFRADNLYTKGLIWSV